MNSQGNERKACDAVLRLLESRSGHLHADLRFPEEDGRGPPVDLRVVPNFAVAASYETRLGPPLNIRSSKPIGSIDSNRAPLSAVAAVKIVPISARRA